MASRKIEAPTTPEGMVKLMGHVLEVVRDQGEDFVARVSGGGGGGGGGGTAGALEKEELLVIRQLGLHLRSLWDEIVVACPGLEGAYVDGSGAVAASVATAEAPPCRSRVLEGGGRAVREESIFRKKVR